MADDPVRLDNEPTDLEQPARYDRGPSIAQLNAALDDEGNIDPAKLAGEASDDPKGDEQDAEPPTDADADDTSTDDDDTSDDDEGSDDSDDTELYALDPAVAAKFPTEAKRYEEQRVGLLKIKAQLEQRGDRAQRVDSWADALEDPRHQDSALAQLVEAIAATKDLSAAEYLQLLVGADNGNDDAGYSSGDDDDRWFDLGFSSKEDYDLAVRMTGSKPAAGRRDREPAAPSALEQRLAALERQEAERAAAAAKQQAVREAMPKVTKAFAREHPGFVVTEQMLAQAIAAAAPGTDPVKALYAEFGQRIAKHAAKAVADHHANRAPEMIRAKGSQGRAKLDWRTVRIADLNRTLE